MFSSFQSNLTLRVVPRVHRVLSHLHTNVTSSDRTNIHLHACMSTSTNDATQNKPLRLVVIGGVAGGASFAARARRLCEQCSITIVEKGTDISFANCGIPYYIGNEITDRDRLKVHTPDSLSKLLNVKVLTHAEATYIDRSKKQVHIIKSYPQKTGTSSSTSGAAQEEIVLPYDKLLLSPGASPFKPAIPGIQYHETDAVVAMQQSSRDDSPKIFTVRTLQDMDKIKAALLQDGRNTATPTTKKIAIVGAGFIGLEMAECIQNLNNSTSSVSYAITLLDASPTVLSNTLDEEIAAGLHAELILQKVQLKLSTTITSVKINTGATSSASTAPLLASLKNVNTQATETAPFDMIIMCIGVIPDSAIAEKSGLTVVPFGMKKFIQVNEYQQTNDEHIYAVGDAILTKDGVTLVDENEKPRSVNVALAGPASRQARIAADHIFLPRLSAAAAASATVTATASAVDARNTSHVIPFTGSIGTSIIRVFDLTVGMVGWTERRLRALNMHEIETTVITGLNHAGFYPGAIPLTLKVIWHRSTHRILGAQVIGDSTSNNHGIDKRTDVIATCIREGITVDKLASLELAYSPPYNSSRDLINLVGFQALNKINNVIKTICTPELIKLILGTNTCAHTNSNTVTGSNTSELILLDVRPTNVSKSTPLVLDELISSYNAANKATGTGTTTTTMKPNVRLLNIPYDELRTRAVKELSPQAVIITFCSVGKLAYFAYRLLTTLGYTQLKAHMGGVHLINLGKTTQNNMLVEHPNQHKH